MVLESIVADACGLQIASMSVDVAAVVKPKLHQSNTTKLWQETLSVDAIACSTYALSASGRATWPECTSRKRL